jgi:2-oxoglutarate ferredoxin oxidoreductase subunit alpha
MARIAKCVVRCLRAKNKKIGLLRPITLWPFPIDIFKKLRKKKVKFLVVEMSYGQMADDVRLSVDGCAPVEFFGRSGGGIPTEKEIIEKIKSL